MRHLRARVRTDVTRGVGWPKIASAEREKRNRVFSQMGVRNLDGYRKVRAERLLRGDTALKNLPAIVIIIDDLADLMMAAPEVAEGLICRLTQRSRPPRMHLSLSTHRPPPYVFTSLIKPHIPPPLPT